MKYPQSPRWIGYYTGRNLEDWLQKSEKCVNHLVDYLPPYINNILIFGCANGRDFIPFDEKDKFDLWGCDITPYETIKWCRQFKRLKYTETSIIDFIELSKSNENFKNLHSFLIYTQGTMMYENQRNQELFYDHCKSLGCKNFIFHEYLTGDYGGECFWLVKCKDEFIIKDYRQITGTQLIAHINLDVNEKTKTEILNFKCDNTALQ
jgi:hypothetical protein